MALPSDLGKLTVPQLKALCKERRITGYSKLGKAALLQRLADVAVPSPSVPVVPSTPHASEAQSTAYIDPGHGESIARAVQPLAASTVTTTKASSLPQPPQDRTVPGTLKRPVHIDTSAPSKRIKTSLEPAPCQTSTPQPTLPDNFSIIPELPVQPPRPLDTSTPLVAKKPFSIRHPVVSSQVTGTARFKPLVPSTLEQVEPDQAKRQPYSRGVDPSRVVSTFDCDFHTSSLPVLSQISFPPRASERKWVHSWAIILSALSPADKKTCMLVSRTFRYAVYLSATHILSRHYSGRRWSDIFEKHPRDMTDFWPYLGFRMDEVARRRHAFSHSFLGQYTNAIGYEPLSAHLWTCPDDEKQVDIALRFVLTRMWFALSVGAYGHDASAWSKCVVHDVQEVVRGEIWQVVTQHKGTGETDRFYVLEATCEVIGRSVSSQRQEERTSGCCLRADWTAWISERSRALPGAGSRSLLEYVKWSNTEDYHRGISKVWLHRVQGEDADSIAKRSVAERYILACVVANGISGQWMCANAMAQEFAGMPSADGALASRTAGRSVHTVNMYLAAHHHIESVHFATSKGEALHGAVAVVQTPWREYYVLRDNGMQVGSEEEGIPEVWQRMIGCDALGRARSL